MYNIVPDRVVSSVSEKALGTNTAVAIHTWVEVFVYYVKLNVNCVIEAV